MAVRCALLIVVLAVAAPALAAPRDPRLAAARTFALDLGGTPTAKALAGYDVVMLALVRRLAKQLGLLFAQNGDDVIDPFLPYLDGWNREDVTRTYDFGRKRYVAVGHADHAEAIAAMRRIAARGKLVTATDYVAA